MYNYPSTVPEFISNFYKICIIFTKNVTTNHCHLASNGSRRAEKWRLNWLHYTRAGGNAFSMGDITPTSSSDSNNFLGFRLQASRRLLSRGGDIFAIPILKLTLFKRGAENNDVWSLAHHMTELGSGLVVLRWYHFVYVDEYGYGKVFLMVILWWLLPFLFSFLVCLWVFTLLFLLFQLHRKHNRLTVQISQLFLFL